MAGHRSRLDAEGLARGQTALLRGRRRETRIADDVAGGEDVRHRGPKRVIDLEPAAVIGRQARGREIEALGGRQPAGREQHRVGHEPLAGLEVEHRAQWRVLGDGQRLHGFAEPERDVALAELVHELVDDLAVEELERPIAALDQGHLHPDGREHRRVLDADDAGADHGQGPGQGFQAHDLIRVEHDLAVRLHAGCRRRARADRDDDVARPHPGRAGLGADGQRVRIEKGRLALDERDVVATQLLLDHLDLAAHDRLDAREELLGGRPTRRPRPGQPVTAGAAAGVREDRFADRLARDGAGTGAHAADTAPLFDHGGAAAELGRLDGRALPGRAAADRNEVVVVVRRQGGHLPSRVILTHSARRETSARTG